MEIFQTEGDWRDMRTKPWLWTASPGRQSVFIETDLKKIENLIHSVGVFIKFEVVAGVEGGSGGGRAWYFWKLQSRSDESWEGPNLKENGLQDK